MKKTGLIFITALLLVITSLPGKCVTESASKQDLQMMKEILVELFKMHPTVEKYFRVNEGESNVTYLQGFGLLIQAPTLSTGSYAYKVIVSGQEHSIKTPETRLERLDSMAAQKSQIAIDIMQDFIIKYGDLARFLQPDEKIFITFDNQDSRLGQFRNITSISGGNAIAIASIGNGQTDSAGETKKITLEVKKDDIDDFKKGKIDADKLKQNIKINRIGESTKPETEYKIFGRILKGVLEDHETGFRSSFGRENQIDYQLLDGLGVIYFLNLNKRGNWIVSPPIPSFPDIEEDVVIEIDDQTEVDIDELKEEISKKKKEAQEKRKVIIEERRQRMSEVNQELEEVNQELANANREFADANRELAQLHREISKEVTRSMATEPSWNEGNAMENYQNLENSLKEAMIEYGRTLNNLEDSNFLILNIDLSDCRNCELPDGKKLMVKGSVLKEYDARKIEMDEALRQIQLENAE